MLGSEGTLAKLQLLESSVIGVLMTTACILRSRTPGNSHVRFCSGGGVSDDLAYHH